MSSRCQDKLYCDCRKLCHCVPTLRPRTTFYRHKIIPAFISSINPLSSSRHYHWFLFDSSNVLQCLGVDKVNHDLAKKTLLGLVATADSKSPQEPDEDAADTNETDNKRAGRITLHTGGRYGFFPASFPQFHCLRRV